MTTPSKLAANRRNALRSTGPRTPEGKARASRNATRHGLLAHTTVLPSEDEGAFDAFRSRLDHALGPVGELEALLVDRIVGMAWRLGRLGRIEAGLLTEDTDDPAETLLRGHKAAAIRLAFKFATEREEIATLVSYEGMLERGLYKALHALERLQAARGGAFVPPPVVLDVDAPIPSLGA